MRSIKKSRHKSKKEHVIIQLKPIKYLSDEVRKKISKNRKGKYSGERHHMKKEKYRKWFSMHNPMRNEETKRKRSGENHHMKKEKYRKWFSIHNPMYNEETKKKALKKNLVRVKSDEFRLLMRQVRLKHLKEGNAVPSFNKSACKFFDFINESLNWNGKHAMNGGEIQVCGYSLDYYEPEKNIVIEWDENKHYKKGKLKEKDVMRQREIINELNCDFYRIRQSDMQLIKVK